MSCCDVLVLPLALTRARRRGGDIGAMAEPPAEASLSAEPSLGTDPTPVDAAQAAEQGAEANA